jgi:hypothetical protein
MFDAIKSGIMRIMLVSEIPIWIDVLNQTIFVVVDSVWTYCENRRNSNFEPTFNLILQSMMHSKLSVLDNIKLLIFF